VSDQDRVVPRPQWPVQPGVVEAQRLLGCPADTCQADDEQVAVHEREVLGPAVVARVEQAVEPTARAATDLRALRGVAERAAPREIVEVVRAAPSWCGPDARERAGHVVLPHGRRDHVIDVELATRRQQAVLAGVARPQADSQSNGGVVVIMLLTSRQLGQQRT
jgi:hypothetical protein